MSQANTVILIHPEKKVVSQKQKYLFLLSFSLALIFTGLFASPLSETWAGMQRILLSPSHLITDYIQLGNLGSAFLNSGLLTLFSVLMARLNKIQVTGPMVAAFLTVAGFSFFGKNFYNSIPIVIGVYCYSRIMKKPFAQYIFISLLGGALSPVVSYITFGMNLSYITGISIGCSTGILIGILLPPLATHFLTLHQGFTLSNIGFTSGIVAMVLTSVLRLFNYEIINQTIISEDYHLFLGIFLFCLFMAMLIWGFILNHGQLRGLKQIYQTSGKLVTDFIAIAEMGPTLINMALMGLLLSSYVLLIKGSFNGPVVGAILSVVGFSAFGNHLKNSLPVLLGVTLIVQFTPLHDLSQVTAITTAIFGISLAPISGYYGMIYGVLAGIFHMALVTNVGLLHGGLNLYNNGFASGFVAAFMVPLLDNFTHIKKKKNK
ncbi:hypothetical protein M2139_002244 [Enterococcus sp. PF1-24]|uniref:DUF1576 domain-containing protein n=1 Tax=unclassified Enterococcus TaxID=2608891 RepID=UPI0024745EE7|nr:MULTISPECIES: DUF1576 domain-containing protein [unclassified Enterococcus]MDH6365242.1 hypothetical protein [Enterococcus sp. PFB1-1]MDH6402343.1 hypothetical protein [Enterococcus sp. PF1-24]